MFRSNLCRLPLAVAVALAAAIPAHAQKRTITHEDVYLAKRLGAPVLSPDGRWAVFTVTEPSYEQDGAVTDLWIVAMDGSVPARRLTSTRAGESGAAWSPDGRRLAFSAKRDGDDAAQIYVLDLGGGGEAQRLTSISTGATAPRWRPDGKAILFTSRIYPGATTDSANRAVAQERRNRKWNARVYEGFPIRNWDQWLDDRSPRLFVQELEPAGEPARDLLAGTQLAQQPGFGSEGANNTLTAAWAPDGGSVVFAAALNRHEAAFADVRTSLYVLDVAGGEPRRILSEDDLANPVFSRDGRTLYAEATPHSERTYHHTRLVAFTWPAPGAPALVAGGADRSIGRAVPAPDARGVFFTSEDAGHVKLFRAAAGRTEEVGRLERGTYSGFDVAGSRTPVIAAIWESAVNPPEIVRVDARTGRATPLTQFNTATAQALDWQPVREFTFTSSKGRRIHNLLVVPPGFDSTRAYPVFALIHGGPHNMWTDQFVIRWNYHLLGAPGYVMLMTNYTGSTGFDEAFAQAIQRDPLKTPGEEINEAVDEAIRRFPFIDGARLVAGGASYGGHLANWLAVTTTRYKALISHAGLWDLESQYGTSDYTYGRERIIGGPPWADDPLWREQSPMQHAENLRTPMLVSFGERDYRVPFNNGLELWTALQRMRVPSKFLLFPNENHWILDGENSRFFYREVHDWIARWLDPAAAQ